MKKVSDLVAPILTASGVSLHFGTGPYVLEDISIALEAGKLTSIVGPSGSGKTTLLRLLAGLLTPDSGSVYFHDQALEGPELRLVPGYEEIRLVSQHPNLSPNITAEENLKVALRGFQASYKEERLHYLMGLFFLEEYRDHYPRELSGGQQQRLTIACAMATEPEVLLMDEPFSALDPSNTSLLIKNIQFLAHQTRTAVALVTHDTRFALMADEVMVISKGKCLQKADPVTIYEAPASKEVAAFFGPVSTIGPAARRTLELSGKSLIIRAENILVKKRGHGFPGTITSHSFMGLYHLIEVRLDTGEKVLAVDFGRTWNKGDHVVIEIPVKKVISLPNPK